jgi:cytoskeletal protein CcmA (bactofilin family)
MEKKSNDSIKKNEKRAIISSSGDLIEFDEHISISGSGKISGGKVNKSIRLAGSGKINGDLECNGLTSSGVLKASGNLTAHGDISSSGSFSVAGFLYGDEEADFSGSTQVGNVIKVQGSLTASGSFKAGHFVTSDKEITFSGSSNINGNLSAEDGIQINGSTNVEGNVVAKNIVFGGSGTIKLRKQHYRVQGRIHAKNIIELVRTHVNGDVRGKVVKLGVGSEILGNVYYVESIEVDKKAKLAHEPIKISLEEL